MARARRASAPTAAPAHPLKEILAGLWEAAVRLRGSVEPSDYKRYVLPLVFLRFLSLRYERRRAELERLVADPESDYFTDDPTFRAATLDDPDEYRLAAAFVVAEAARSASIVAAAQRDDIRLRLDNVLELLETTYPDQLRGLLPRVYAGSNLDPESVRGLVNMFSGEVFERDHGGADVIGLVYEYFIGEFAASEGKRGGEYFTPQSIVRVLVAMLEPAEGIVYDPCCGSGGMFVQSDLFAQHRSTLSFYGQESKESTYRLCRMNLFIHGLEGDIGLGNSYYNGQHPKLRADFILANPPFNDRARAPRAGAASASRPTTRA